MDSSPNNWATSQYQPMSSKMPFSSPIKPSDASASYDMDILEDLHQHQQDRANRIHYPLSSPIKNTLDHEHRRSSQYHHQNQQGRTAIINKRNKHDRLREIRDRHRQDKLGMNREKIVDRQAYEDYKLKLEREANELYDVLDIDELINQENELESHINESLPKHMYETELDAILNEEQQELEQMVANIDLSDNKYAST